MKADFTPLYEVRAEEDYEWLNANAPKYLKMIKAWLTQGATVEEITEEIQSTMHAGREAFVLRCEGAARYVMARKG